MYVICIVRKNCLLLDKMSHPMVNDGIWFDKWRFDDAETMYQMKLSGCIGHVVQGAQSEIAPVKTEQVLLTTSPMS